MEPSIPEVVSSTMSKPYGVEEFTADLQSMKPRFVDTWVIPPLMLWFAVKVKGRGYCYMHRWARRMLFSAGIYMIFRNFSEYKAAAKAIASMNKPSVSSLPEVSA